MSALLAVATALFAQHKPEFSLRIHPIRDTFAVTDSVITLEVTTTNLTERRLDSTKWGMPYTYIVRRNGVPVPKAEPPYPEMIYGDPKGLPPHGSKTGDVYLAQHVDMSQPGKYTIQVDKDGVKSNVVTVTVIPHW